MKFTFPISRFEVRDRSMEPMFKSGDHVLTFNWGDIKKGSVVVFRFQNSHPETLVEGSDFNKMRFFAPFRMTSKTLLIKRVKDFKGNKVIAHSDNKKLAKELFLIKKEDIVGRVFIKY